MRNKVSVCVTTYNRAGMLDRTLASIAAQTRQPDELIVSDDCSTDETEQVVRKWQNQFSGFHYSRNASNLNMPGNLNAAIRLATGDYIANLHDADEFDSTLLEKWERALDTYPSAGFVFCGIGGWPHLTDFGEGIILHDVDPFTPGRQFFEKHMVHRLTSIVWGTVMARRTAYEQLLPFDATFGFVSDVDMWMRMCVRYDVAYVREALIILDNSSTKERNTATVNWKWIEWAREMQLANIHRFYGDDSERLARELARHRRVVQPFYFRILLGRLWHRDWQGLRLGLRACSNLSGPLRWAGMFASGRE